MVVIAVEEATLLVAVDRIVGRVDVENDLFRHPCERGDEALDQNLVNRPRPTPIGPVLEAAQGRRAGQLTVPPGRRLQARVMAQIGVVVEVLVAQRDPEHALAQHVRHRMTPLAALARIAQPTRHRRRQTETPIRLAKKQRTAVAGHNPAVETRLHPAPTTGWKPHPLLSTIRHRRAPVSDSS